MVNKVDILSSDSEVEEVTNFVANSATRMLGVDRTQVESQQREHLFFGRRPASRKYWLLRENCGLKNVCRVPSSEPHVDGRTFGLGGFALANVIVGDSD